MLEWVMVIASVVFMARVADMERRSNVFWGALTLGLCLASMLLVPLPLVRVALACGLSFVIMFVAKIVQG